LERVTGIEPA